MGCSFLPRLGTEGTEGTDGSEQASGRGGLLWPVGAPRPYPVTALCAVGTRAVSRSAGAAVVGTSSGAAAPSARRVGALHGLDPDPGLRHRAAHLHERCAQPRQFDPAVLAEFLPQFRAPVQPHAAQQTGRQACLATGVHARGTRPCAEEEGRLLESAEPDVGQPIVLRWSAVSSRSAGSGVGRSGGGVLAACAGAAGWLDERAGANGRRSRTG